MVGALGVDQAFLLRGVERGCRARLQPLLDQIEHACGARKVFTCDAQTVLRREHLEIGVGGGDHRGEADHLAIVAAGDRGLFRGAHQGAVLAPKIDFVARVKRGREVVADDRDASSGSRNADDVCAAGCFGLLCVLGVAVEIDNRQQRGAGDAGIGVGLHDAGDRCGDIEIALSRRFDDFGQFARAEGAPPIERRNCRFRRSRIARADSIERAEYRAPAPACRRSAGSPPRGSVRL